MTGDLLDVVLVVAVLLFAVSGYRQGLVVGVLSFVGFVGGGVLGAQIAPSVAASITSGRSQPLVGLLIVFVAAVLGQVLARAVGAAVRRRLSWSPARLVDSLGGAAVSVAAVLVVAWFLGSIVAGSPFGGLADQVRRSRVLAAVDSAMPAEAHTWFSSLRRLVDEKAFPQIFARLSPPPAAPVAPPDPAVAGTRAVALARDDVVRVTGVARVCSRGLQGSGFVYGTERVMTNAHVVAGVDSPQVEVGRRRLPARVVLFDPNRDIAVLYVPGLDRRPLSFAGPARPGDPAVVAGYPENGPFTAVAARIRGSQRVTGPDIYQRRTVTREVYAVRAVVRPGNSGGPLLDPNGGVYGVVFAAAADGGDTGYALTAAEVAPDARAGATATTPVGTDGCD